MKNTQNSLQKRLRSDTIFTYLLTAGLAIAAIVRTIDFFTVLRTAREAGEVYDGISPGTVIEQTLLCVFAAVVMLLLSLVLGGIHSTGKPFSKNNIRLLQTIAYVLLAASIVPEVGYSIFSAWPDFEYLTFQIDMGNIIIMFFGATIGLISEIFKYGNDLQDNMDSIA